MLSFFRGATAAVVLTAANCHGALLADLSGSRAAYEMCAMTAVDFDVDGDIDAALDTQRMVAVSRQVTLERSGEASGVRVLGDEGRLQQIVWNLLTNAVKFSNPGGRVEVSLRREGDCAVLKVRDDASKEDGKGWYAHPKGSVAALADEGSMKRDGIDPGKKS